MFGATVRLLGWEGECVSGLLPDREPGDLSAALYSSSHCDGQERLKMKIKLFGTGVRLLGTVLLLLAISNFSNAQSSATISGFVSDEHGAKINGAEVTLYSKTGLERRVKTDS